MFGYLEEPKYNPATDIRDLSGKVVIVTGGNSGLGCVTIRELARKGAKVYMGARSENRALDAIRKLKDEGIGSGSVEFLRVDLASIKSAKKAADEFLLKENQLDILVNNAAMLASPYKLTDEGILDSMATNHLGPFVFTTTLLPALKKAASANGSDVRVINVSATALSYAPKDVKFDSLGDLNRHIGDGYWPSFARYGTSKLANLLFGRELQRRLDEQDPKNRILVVSLHPGLIFTPGATEGMKYLPWPIRFIVPIVMPYFTLTLDEGAYTSLFAATSPVVRANREFFKNGWLYPFTKMVPFPSEASKSDQLARTLWETSDGVVTAVLGKGVAYNIAT